MVSPVLSDYAPQNQNPIGYFDYANCEKMVGWACDADDYSKALSIHFYAEGKAGQGGTIIGSTIANLTRETAVGNKCGGNSNHGFSFSTPDSLKDGKNHTIYAYAINTPSGTNPLLGTNAKVIASSCTNECSQASTKQCNGDGYQTCGNYDDDSCLEWSTITNCPQDYCHGDLLIRSFCEQGTCKQSIGPCFDCSCSCGNYGLTTEAGYCGDQKDNDCDGLEDSADCDCGVSITGISLPKNATENTNFNVSCTASGSLDCVRASIDAESCFHINTNGNTSISRCNAGEHGEKTVKCYVISECCAISPIGALEEITVNPSKCSAYDTESLCEETDGCEWCQKCEGNKYNLMGDKCVEKGNCQHFCKEGFCNAECEKGQTYPESCIAGVWKKQGTCSETCELTQETETCSGSCGTCQTNSCLGNSCSCQRTPNCCGNGICESGETCESCNDCKCSDDETCIDGACTKTEENPPENPAYCGNDICEQGENCNNCTTDCKCSTDQTCCGKICQDNPECDGALACVGNYLVCKETPPKSENQTGYLPKESTFGEKFMEIVKPIASEKSIYLPLIVLVIGLAVVVWLRKRDKTKKILNKLEKEKRHFGK